MEETKILIANENLDENKEISEKLTKDNDLFKVKFATNGREATQLIQSEKFDCLILDLVLAEVDGFDLIEIAKNANPKIKILVMTALTSETFIKKAMSMGSDYYMVKPVSFDTIVKRVNDMTQNINDSSIVISKNDSEKSIEEKITNIFITVGIPAHIKGYQFLREAIKLAMEDPDIINSITKKLYPSIAERFDTSASKVERAIRHAIEVAWNRGKIENINNIFGLTVYTNNEKPTNGEFIALVADKMLLDV